MPSRHPDTLAVKVTLLSVSVLTVMVGAALAPSLPAMRQHFVDVPHVDYWVRLVLTTPALFIALGAPIAGTIIDRFGRKHWLVISVFCYGLAGSSGLFLNEIGWILLGRLVLGLSVAGTMTTATTLIADYYLGAARAQFLGFQAASIGLGGVFVLTLGGYLADISWRLPFLLYAVAWLLVPLVVLVLPEPERRSPVETMPLEVASPELMPWVLVMTTFAIALLVQIAFYMIPTQLPFYLQRLTNTNGSQTGLAIALTISAAATSSLNYQRLKARLAFAAIYALGFGLMGTGYLVISQAPSYGTVAIGLAITGLGLGLFSPNMTVCLTSSTPAALRGRILGGLTTSFFLGQFVSPLVSQPLSQRLGMAATYGLAGGLLIILGGISLGVMAHWRGLDQRQRSL